MAGHEFLANYTAADGTKQKCYWSRGNGWAFAALARTMDVLPTTDAHYAERICKRFSKWPQ